MWVPVPVEGAPPYDASFTEAISHRMRVPPRLRAPGPEEEEATPEEALPPSFRMYIPERLCLAEMLDIMASRPLFGARPQQPWCLSEVERPLLEPLTLGFLPWAQKRLRPGHRGRKDRAGPSSEVAAGPRKDCPREVSLVLEEFGPTDALAVRKQLMNISGRLRVLERQSLGWRQKELLFYSILASACILNAWLWLRR
ncbi:mitochondrial fission factor-like [Anolis sagrei]|uniref:mitochondrial fission factor-like n=1 Tax=Anolis sagrei TaxID=38937 RepID=UPI0035200D0C